MFYILVLLGKINFKASESGSRARIIKTQSMVFERSGVGFTYRRKNSFIEFRGQLLRGTLLTATGKRKNPARILVNGDF